MKRFLSVCRVYGVVLKKPDESPGGFRMTALQAKGLRKFLRKDCVNKETGEIVASSDIKALIDLEKVNEYTRDMGYYRIVSSGLTSEALGKWKINRLPGDWYRFMDADDPDLKFILDAFGLRLPAKRYRRAELKISRTLVSPGNPA